MRISHWISGRFHRLINRYYNSLGNDVLLALVYLLRERFDLPSYGSDVSKDRHLYKSLNQFTRPDKVNTEPTEELRDFVSWLSSDPTSNLIRDIYLRIEHRLSTAEEEKKSINELYKSLYSRDLLPLKPWRVWTTRKRVRTLLRECKGAWLDKNYRKFEFGIRDIVAYIPLISFLLICSGYFHTSIVYENFGLNPTQFFSIGDYLAASLQQIEHAILPCISALAGIFFAYVREPAMPRLRIASEIRKDNFYFHIIVVSSAGTLGVLAFTWERWATSANAAMAVGFPMLFIIAQIVSLIPLHFLKNKVRGRIMLTALVLFCSLIVAGSHVKINMIEHGHIYDKFKIVAGDTIYTQKSSRIIGSNSSYLFIWNGEKKVWVIPWSKVENMEIDEE